MQIIIDVPETIYKAIKEDTYCGILDADVYYAIKDGTPLPKGHGRLIDADELKADIHMNKRNRYATQRDVDCTFNLLNDAPTIIEADESESEDKRR